MERKLGAFCPKKSPNRCDRLVPGQLANATGIRRVDWLVFAPSSIIIPLLDSVWPNGRNETRIFSMKIIAWCMRRKSKDFPSWFHSIQFLIVIPFHRNEHVSRNTTNHTNHMVDHNQERSTKQLRERTHDVYKWKTTLERAIKAQMDEISSLAEQRDRLMVALSVLDLPESIGKSHPSYPTFKWPQFKRDFQPRNALSVDAVDRTVNSFAMLLKKSSSKRWRSSQRYVTSWMGCWRRWMPNRSVIERLGSVSRQIGAIRSMPMALRRSIVRWTTSRRWLCSDQAPRDTWMSWVNAFRLWIGD